MRRRRGHHYYYRPYSSKDRSDRRDFRCGSTLLDIYRRCFMDSLKRWSKRGNRRCCLSGANASICCSRGSTRIAYGYYSAIVLRRYWCSGGKGRKVHRSSSAPRSPFISSGHSKDRDSFHALSKRHGEGTNSHGHARKEGGAGSTSDETR